MTLRTESVARRGVEFKSIGTRRLRPFRGGSQVASFTLVVCHDLRARSVALCNEPRPADAPVQTRRLRRCFSGRSHPGKLRRLTPLGHVRPQHGVHSRLIPWTPSLEPVQYVGVYAQRDRLLRYRLDDRRLVPKVFGKIRQLGRRRGANLALTHAAQSTEIGATQTNLITSSLWLSCSLGVHGGHSCGPK